MTVEGTKSAPASPRDDVAALLALAERDAPPTHWELLGVDETATPGEVKRAYYAASKRFHPDQFRNVEGGRLVPLATQLFQSVREAYEVLSDPVRRETYARTHPSPEKAEPASNDPDERRHRLESRRREILEERRKARARRKLRASAPRRGKASELYELGRMHLQRGEVAAAIRSFRLALGHDPGHRPSRDALEEAERLGDPVRATQLARQAREEEGRGQLRRAATLFGQAHVLCPARVRYAVRAAEVWMDVGELEEARSFVEKALELAPRLPDAHRAAARYFEQTGDARRAREHLEEAARLAPADARGRKTTAQGKGRRRS